MANNSIENITNIRLLDGVLQYNNGGIWKVAKNAVELRTAGFGLQLSDIGKYIRVNSASDVNVTILNLPYQVGDTVTLEQTGAGTVTITSSVATLRGNVISAGQYKVLQLICVAFNEWTVIGGTA